MDIRIESLDDRGYPVANNGLVIGQDITFEADSFLEIAHVLGEFHALGQRINNGQDSSP